MKDNYYGDLPEMFEALRKVREALGEQMHEQIRHKLADGHLARREADLLQDHRRRGTANYLGMTGDEYEDFLEGKSTKASKKIDDRKTILTFLELKND